MTLTPNEQLLAALLLRNQKSTGFNRGILTADRYLKTLQDCVCTDLCNRFCAMGNLSWNDQLKRAASTLTYNNDEMVVEDQYTDWQKSFDKKDIYGVDIELPKNTLMVFKHTLTSPKKDRDGDILRTKGARPDPQMLMIWQHQHTLPIGKMLGIAEHTAKRLAPISAIVDINALAHDSAVMIDNKMGRFSHGFRALSFSEVKESDENGKVTSPGGFDIKEFEIMEESLVSVPANTDAQVEEIILSLVSGGKLTSPWMKSYGKVIQTKRPLSLNIPGSYPVTTEEVEVFNAEIDAKASTTGTKCGCGCNGAPGGCGKSTPAETDADDDETDNSEQQEMKCPKCGYPMKDGACAKCGAEESAEKSVTQEKSGRVLSAKNFARVTQAKQNLQEICDTEMLMTPGGKEKARTAKLLLEEVITAATPIITNPMDQVEQISQTVSISAERSSEVSVKDAMVCLLTKSTVEERAHLLKTLTTMRAIEKSTELGAAFSRLSGQNSEQP